MTKIERLRVTSTQKTGTAGNGAADLLGRPELRSPTTGRFRQGKSGNPAGRPPGSANDTHLRLRGMLLEQSEAVVRRVVVAALSGDMIAARIVLDRALPRRVCRPSMGLDLLVLKTGADAADALAKIVEGVANGFVSSTEAADLAKIIEVFTGTLVINEMASRIELLEAQHCEAQR